MEMYGYGAKLVIHFSLAGDNVRARDSWHAHIQLEMTREA